MTNVTTNLIGLSDYTIIPSPGNDTKLNERGDGAPRPAMRARARWFPSSRVGALRCDCKGSRRARAYGYLGVRCRRAMGRIAYAEGDCIALYNV